MLSPLPSFFFYCSPFSFKQYPAHLPLPLPVNATKKRAHPSLHNRKVGVSLHLAPLFLLFHMLLQAINTQLCHPHCASLFLVFFRLRPKRTKPRRTAANEGETNGIWKKSCSPGLLASVQLVFWYNTVSHVCMYGLYALSPSSLQGARPPIAFNRAKYTDAGAIAVNMIKGSLNAKRNIKYTYENGMIHVGPGPTPRRTSPP